ncbi:MAG: MBOAT family O-acyltransferase [Eubacteriales bacterium]
MTFTTWLYGLFLTGVTAAYWVLPRSWRNPFLLGASAVFLAYFLPLQVLLLFFVSTAVYIVGSRLRSRGFMLAFAIVFIVSILAYYKYQGLIADLLHKLAVWLPALPAFKVPPLVVPLGISFFTFKLIHYMVDSYRGTRPQGSYGQFLLYIFLFPILPSGPIERWPDFLRQNRELHGFQWAYLAEGSQRIISGLFKKLVVADTAAVYAAKMHVTGLGGFAYWIAAYAYAVQIYFDFSGYSDIAIGSARLFGYKIMENFNYPYLKRNLSLFWKSWHISLTSWFRDYIFIPLGGSRVPFGRVIMNTLIVMGLTGLWHGAALHFIAWGLFHGLGLITLRLYGKYVYGQIPTLWRDSGLMTVAGTLLTFHFVVIGWVFFATDFGQSIYVIRKLLFMI